MKILTPSNDDRDAPSETFSGCVPILTPYILKHHLTSLLASTLLCVAANSQTPIANRIRGVARSLPQNAAVVARYADHKRHSLYYVAGNRLYRYDVITGKREESVFANTSYTRILNTWLSPDGSSIFIAVDKGLEPAAYMDRGHELWRYDSYTGQSYRIGQGFKIVRLKGCYVIKRATRCLNPSEPFQKQRWMAQDHYYDLDGKIIWAKDEYEVDLR